MPNGTLASWYVAHWAPWCVGAIDSQYYWELSWYEEEIVWCEDWLHIECFVSYVTNEMQRSFWWGKLGVLRPGGAIATGQQSHMCRSQYCDCPTTLLPPAGGESLCHIIETYTHYDYNDRGKELVHEMVGAGASSPDASVFLELVCCSLQTAWSTTLRHNSAMLQNAIHKRVGLLLSMKQRLPFIWKPNVNKMG